jgi:hypothetical protein
MGASDELTTHMKSVGEVLAIGRTFAEAFGKAMSARELDVKPAIPDTCDQALGQIARATWDRYDVMLWAARQGATTAQLSTASLVHPWFCDQIVTLANAEYFVDADPGLGNGTPVAAADGAAHPRITSSNCAGSNFWRISSARPASVAKSDAANGPGRLRALRNGVRAPSTM